jgi:hypothetical protein
MYRVRESESPTPVYLHAALLRHEVNAWDYWVFWISETGSVSETLRSLEYLTMDEVKKAVIPSVIISPSSEAFRIYKVHDPAFIT